jgi:hypothetical protein
MSCRLSSPVDVPCGPACVLCDRTSRRHQVARSLASSAHTAPAGSVEAALAANPYAGHDSSSDEDPDGGGDTAAADTGPQVQPRAAPRLAWAAAAVGGDDASRMPALTRAGASDRDGGALGAAAGFGAAAGDDDRDVERGLLGGGDNGGDEKVRIDHSSAVGHARHAVRARGGPVPANWLRFSGDFQVIGLLKGSYVFGTTHLGDGMIDVLALKDSGRFQLLRGLASIVLRSKSGAPAGGVAGEKTREVVIDMDGGTTGVPAGTTVFLVDGDTFTTSLPRVTVRCHQGAVRICW